MSGSVLSQNQAFDFTIAPGSATLQIAGIDVDNNGGWVPSANGIGISFSSNIDCDTITGGTVLFTDVDDNAVPYTMTCDSVTNSIVVNPTNWAMANFQTENVVLTLTTGIQTTAGEALTSQQSYLFYVDCFGVDSGAQVIGDTFINDTLAGNCWTNFGDAGSGAIANEALEFTVNGGAATVYKTFEVPDEGPFISITAKLDNNAANDWQVGGGEAIGVFISTNDYILAADAFVVHHGTSAACGAPNQCLFPYIWENGFYDNGPNGDVVAIGAGGLYMCLVQTGGQTAVAYTSVDGSTWTPRAMQGVFDVAPDSTGPLRGGIMAISSSNLIEDLAGTCINTAASNGDSTDCCNPDDF